MRFCFSKKGYLSFCCIFCIRGLICWNPSVCWLASDHRNPLLHPIIIIIFSIQSRPAPAAAVVNIEFQLWWRTRRPGDHLNPIASHFLSAHCSVQFLGFRQYILVGRHVLILYCRVTVANNRSIDDLQKHRRQQMTLFSTNFCASSPMVRSL